MRGYKSFVPLLLFILAALVWFVFIAEPVSKWFSRITNRAYYNGHVIGKVVRAEGSTRILHRSDIKIVPSPTERPIEMRDGSQLQTSVDSRAIFILNSQDELELGPGGLIQFQLWNPKDPNSPIYIRSSLGELTVKKAGVKGRVFIVKEGRLYLPGQKPLARPMALTVLRSAPLDLSLADETPQGEAAANDPNKNFDETEVAPNVAEASGGVDPDTLSNEYIDETIASRHGLLQKCWLSRLKDAPQLKGSIVLQFEITRRGRVKDIRVTDASLEDETLTKCVISVVSRIYFRQDKGPEISLSYPINFE